MRITETLIEETAKGYLLLKDVFGSYMKTTFYQYLSLRVYQLNKEHPNQIHTSLPKPSSNDTYTIKRKS